MAVSAAIAAWLLVEFHWLLYVFGAFLVLSLKMPSRGNAPT
jgi:predicted tellurium resistance membrane protein TerC